MTPIFDDKKILAAANTRLKEMPGYEEGMEVSSIEKKGDVFVIYTEMFLLNNGSATEKTLRVLPVYEELKAWIFKELLPSPKNSLTSNE